MIPTDLDLLREYITLHISVIKNGLNCTNCRFVKKLKDEANEGFFMCKNENVKNHAGELVWDTMICSKFELREE